MTIAIIAVFCAGYAAIAFESVIRINKAATALLTAVTCWTIYMTAMADKHTITAQLMEHVGSFSGILFFLMGAMTIVELIDAHNGFDLIINRIHVLYKRTLLIIIVFLTFFLSAVLDNLTTTIVMMALTMKFSLTKEEQMLFIGMIVIAANAGGAWSPIGDVTTTMLWIDGRLTSFPMIYKLILPSFTCAVIPLLMILPSVKGPLERVNNNHDNHLTSREQMERNSVFIFGIASLLFVPVFKGLTHLPPFMGMLLALGMLWFFTEVLHMKKSESQRKQFSVAQALSNIDMPAVLFFLGILASIAALESTGVLGRLATALNTTFKGPMLVDFMIGLLSAVVDNVPLVAGAMGMYSLADFGVDHHFWTFLSYCAGTGGSALIIGSAAGVAAMGIAQIDFLWYLKKISLLAISGYIGGAVVYIILKNLIL